MAAAIRSRTRTTTTRRPLNRSRSGDGLLRPRRQQRRTVPCMAVLLVFLALTMLVVVATVQHGSGAEHFNSIRKRHLQRLHVLSSHNSDEVGDDDGGDYGAKYADGDDDETTQDPNKEEEAEINAAKEAREAAEAEESLRLWQEKEAKESAEREEREQQIRKEKDEELERLRAEKERLERQLKEEEEQRQRAERAAQEAARLKEEEERQKMEEEARLKALEEERENERLELLRKQEQRLKEEEAKRRQQADEVRKQRELQQEQELQRQQRLRKEQQEKRQRVQLENLKKEEEQPRQPSLRQRPHVPLNKPQSQKSRGADTEDNAPKSPADQPEIKFCDVMRRMRPNAKPEPSGTHGFSNPAVLVLGMEDSSTDLVWHVISQILYPGRTVRRTHQLQDREAAIDYKLLDKVGDDSVQTKFWDRVPDKSKGKWLLHVFCQQQENAIAAGFPWITSPNKITDNHKAQETLEVVQHLPKGSLKILRIKRNPLDVVIRQAQREQKARVGTPITLDRKKIFRQLRQLETEQDAIDKYLQENNVPHLTLDFETIFPFDHWTNLVLGVQTFQGFPNHINVDWGSLSTDLETTWRDVLRYLDIYKPHSMFDILHHAMETHHVNSFWPQREAIDKVAYIERALQGTHYQRFLRKQRPASQFDNLKKQKQSNELGDEM